VVGAFTPSTYGAIFVGNDMSRLLNRVAGIGFIVFGIGLLVAAANQTSGVIPEHWPSRAGSTLAVEALGA
jgi:hypothetical protein